MGLAAHAQEKLALPDLLARMKTVDAAVQNLSFHYEQTQRSGNIQSASGGEILIRRPSGLRLVQEGPQRLVVVSNGKRVWVYSPAQNQQLVGSWKKWVKTSALPLPALGFLRHEEWQDRYEIHLETHEEHRYRLQLSPKDRVLLPVTLWVDDQTFLPVQGRVGTTARYSEIVVTDMKINPEAPDSLFDHRPPVGTAVVPLP